MQQKSTSVDRAQEISRSSLSWNSYQWSQTQEASQPSRQLLEGSGGEQSSESIPTGVVCLLKATKIPSGYEKLVCAKVKGNVSNGLSLFTPGFMESDLSMPDSALELTDGSCVVLVVQNHGTEPIWLKKGQILGEIVPVTELPQEGVLHSYPA